MFLATLFVISKTKDSPDVLQWVNCYTNSNIAISQYHSIMKTNVAVINATTLVHIQRIMLNPPKKKNNSPKLLHARLFHFQNTLEMKKKKKFYERISRGYGGKEGRMVKKEQCENPVVTKMFCILTESMSIPWLSYCTTTLQLSQLENWGEMSKGFSLYYFLQLHVNLQ